MRAQNRESGVVLVMVLIVLVALMLIGIGVMRTTGIENLIAGNELRYQRDFYTAEGASDYTVAKFDDLMYTKALSVGGQTDLGMPAGSAIEDADVVVKLERTGAPPLGSGTSAAYTSTNYYRVTSTFRDQTVEVGLWKSYPTPQ